MSRNEPRDGRSTAPLIAGIAAGCAVGAIVALLYNLPGAAAAAGVAALALVGYHLYADGF